MIIPAHNEEALLDACLASLRLASEDPALMGERVCIAVVLDHCTDASASIAARYPVQTIAVTARNVGLARRIGARRLLACGARWLAFTDADTVVSPTWLSDQLALDAEAVCGVVTVRDWSEHSPEVRQTYETRYHYRDGHSHVHGANLGMSAKAYCVAGGFSALPAHEDVALVDALGMTGAKLAWSVRPRVYTSARKHARAVGGFADYLAALATVPTLE